jgi:molybdenum cofactor cytidylyltransferase
MGEPKQLLKLGGITLVRRAAEVALASQAWPVVIVLGSSARLVQAEIATLPLLPVVNAEWAAGIGTSLRLGIQTLDRSSTALAGAIVLLADQPGLTAGAIDAIAEAGMAANTLAAAAYHQTVGAPAYFPRSHFAEIQALLPAEGAQRHIRQHAEKVISVPRPELGTDLDTPADVRDWVLKQ